MLMDKRRQLNILTTLAACAMFCLTILMAHCSWAAEETVGVDKTTILKKAMAAYNQPELSGEIEETGLSSTNTDITTFKKIKFWIKQNKSRMEVIQLPNTPRASQTTTINDGTAMWTYRAGSNVVMKMDLTKLPEDLRGSLIQQGSFVTKKLAEHIDDLLELASVEEKVKDGKKYYYVTIKDLNLLREPVRRKIAPNDQVKKILLQIDANNYRLARIETYGNSERPTRWTDYKNIDTQPIDDSLFVYAPPADAQISDITETAIKMFEGKNR